MKENPADTAAKLVDPEIGLHLLRQMSDYLYRARIDDTGSFTYDWTDERFTGITGLSPEQLNRQGLIFFLEPEDMSRILNQLSLLLEGQPVILEYSLPHPGHQKRYLREYAIPVSPCEDSQTTRFWVAGTDISREKELELEAAGQRESLERAQQMANMGSWDWDMVQDCIRWSNQVYRILQIEPGGEENLREVTSRAIPEIQQLNQAIQNAIHGNGIIDFIHHYQLPDGQKILVHLRGQVIRNSEGIPLRMIGTIQDITEKERAGKRAREQEMQLMQADRLAALGTLVSGIAHEINNPNNYMRLNALILKRSVPDLIHVLSDSMDDAANHTIAGVPFDEMRKELPKAIHAILEGSRRIQKLVENLKRFSRKSTSADYKQIQLEEVIENAIDILGHEIEKATKHFSCQKPKKLPFVMGDDQQLEQVVINLLLNACQALRSADESIVVRFEHDVEREIVSLIIQDEGAGMTEDQVNHMCDPFYTTRADRGGTGLGLSISRKIVHDHKGQLHFVSSPEKGTSAILKLPVAGTGEIQ